MPFNPLCPLGVRGKCYTPPAGVILTDFVYTQGYDFKQADFFRLPYTNLPDDHIEVYGVLKKGDDWLILTPGSVLAFQISPTLWCGITRSTLSASISYFSLRAETPLTMPLPQEDSVYRVSMKKGAVAVTIAGHSQIFEVTPLEAQITPFLGLSFEGNANRFTFASRVNHWAIYRDGHLHHLFASARQGGTPVLCELLSGAVIYSTRNGTGSFPVISGQDAQKQYIIQRASDN